MKEAPIEWGWPCSLRDILAVEALSDEMRASVERYVQSRGGAGVNPSDDDYIAGWKDGVEAMQDEITSVYVNPPSRRRRANESRGAMR